MDTETKKDSYHIDTLYALLDMTEWKTHVSALNGCGLSRTQARSFTALIFFATKYCKCFLSSSVLVVYFKCITNCFIIGNVRPVACFSERLNEFSGSVSNCTRPN
jgi:hypothetical protein